MSILPQTEETIIKIIYCPLCQKYYSEQTGPTRMCCAVAHAPGTCCHYGDVELVEEAIETMRLIVGVKK